MAFLALGDAITAALFQTGRFTGQDSKYVWAILAGSAVGLDLLARLDLLASRCGDLRRKLAGSGR